MCCNSSIFYCNTGCRTGRWTWLTCLHRRMAHSMSFSVLQVSFCHIVTLLKPTWLCLLIRSFWYWLRIFPPNESWYPSDTTKACLYNPCCPLVPKSKTSSVTSGDGPLVQNKVRTDKLYESETLCPEGFSEHAGSKTGFARASIDGRLFEETGQTCYI